MSDLSKMFKELVAADIITYGGGNGKEPFSFSAGVQYGETFAKCFSGVHTIDSYEELRDLYNKWKQAEWTGVVAWLSIKEKCLPLYWYLPELNKKYDFNSLNLPSNPRDEFYRKMFSKHENNN